MITNKGKFFHNIPDVFYFFLFVIAITGFSFGVAGFFDSPLYLLAFLGPLISGVLIGGMLTSAYEQLKGVHLSLFKSYEGAPEQVRKDIGEITVKQIQSMSSADAEKVKNAIVQLNHAYNRHRASIPDSRVAVLLDNAETATKAYQELT